MQEIARDDKGLLFFSTAAKALCRTWPCTGCLKRARITIGSRYTLHTTLYVYALASGDLANTAQRTFVNIFAVNLKSSRSILMSNCDDKIWYGGRWHYLGASEISEFDHTWFSNQASQAIEFNEKHGIFASSFRRTNATMVCQNLTGARSHGLFSRLHWCRPMHFC